MTRDRLNGPEIDTYVALMEISSQLRYRLDTHLREVSELSNVQFDILGNLMRAEGQRRRMTDIADGMVLSRSGLTYQVGVLEEKGLVTRAPSEDDERSTTVELTDEGRRRFLDVLPGHVGIVRSMIFDVISESEARSLGRTLGRLRRQARSLPPRSIQQRG